MPQGFRASSVLLQRCFCNFAYSQRHSRVATFLESLECDVEFDKEKRRSCTTSRFSENNVLPKVILYENRNTSHCMSGGLCSHITKLVAG